MNPNLSYRPDIDGLRAMAVLAVVLHPLFAPLVPGGHLPVIAIAASRPLLAMAVAR